MKFESKYDIGQILYEIKVRQRKASETCECCGQNIWSHEWYVDGIEQEIHGIGMKSDGTIYYRVYRPCVYREQLAEHEGYTYFTSIKDAQAKCDELNSTEAKTKNGE